MSDFLRKLQALVKNPNIWKGVGLTLVLVGIHYYMYTTPKTTHVIKSNNHTNNDTGVLVTFYSFDYCGYCKKFQPMWEEAQTRSYPMNVEFRKIEGNTMSDAEKKKIPFYVESSFAPNIILTQYGKNTSEFQQQPDKPLNGLVEFISSRGEKNSNKNPKHIK